MNLFFMKCLRCMSFKRNEQKAYILYEINANEHLFCDEIIINVAAIYLCAFITKKKKNSESEQLRSEVKI